MMVAEHDGGSTSWWQNLTVAECDGGRTKHVAEWLEIEFQLEANKESMNMDGGGGLPRGDRDLSPYRTSGCDSVQPAVE